MAEITAAMVKDLREKTDAPMMECKKALAEAGGDLAKAEEILRVKLGSKAAKASSRVAAEGIVAVNVSADGKLGTIVEVNCETDFVARNEDFQAFCREVALQVAAMNPQFVRKEEVDPEVVEKERAVLVAKAKESGKPEPVAQKMVEGQIAKWLKEICLMDQSFVKNPDKTIDQVQQELVAKIGENIKIRRFTRFELGEGLEKKKNDFAAEVAAQAGLSS